jgi:hypothetical protein
MAKANPASTYDPTHPAKPSLTDGLIPAEGERRVVQADNINSRMNNRKHDTGHWARLSREVQITKQGIVGKVQYGVRGDRVQVMQFDPSKSLCYGVRKEGENFWTVSVGEDDLLCEYSIASTHGFMVVPEDPKQGPRPGTKAEFREWLKAVGVEGFDAKYPISAEEPTL